ncbi:MAG: thiosulfate oxidation carrier protein SoxY [Xanthobacteraceae bacterium]|jgi:sulfur-oxidizing protein SoxY
MAHSDNRPDRARRLVLKGLLAGIGLGLTGLWQRARAAADAAIWPKDAFAQKAEADTIKTLYGKDAEASDQVKLDAPEIAENGAVVPIAVSSALPNVTTISILVAENPNPLAASYKIPPGTSAMVANRLKMAKTSKVIALVESNGKIYSATKEVKVTVGGCGG